MNYLQSLMPNVFSGLCMNQLSSLTSTLSGKTDQSSTNASFEKVFDSFSPRPVWPETVFAGNPEPVEKAEIEKEAKTTAGMQTTQELMEEKTACARQSGG